MTEEKNNKTNQALYLLDVIMSQWMLFGKDDTLISLCIKKDESWAIVEARRMTFNDADVAILNSIGKASESKKLSVSTAADYVG